jgi:hypothetical protein
MSRLSRQLNSAAFSVLRLVLLAFRPTVLVLFGLVGGVLCLVAGQASAGAVVAASCFTFVALLGVWWGWQNWRRGPHSSAILAARIVDSNKDDEST